MKLISQSSTLLFVNYECVSSLIINRIISEKLTTKYCGFLHFINNKYHILCCPTQPIYCAFHNHNSKIHTICCITKCSRG